MVFLDKTGIVLSETMAKIDLPKKISFGKSGGTDAYVVCCQLMWQAKFEDPWHGWVSLGSFGIAGGKMG